MLDIGGIEQRAAETRGRSIIQSPRINGAATRRIDFARLLCARYLAREEEKPSVWESLA